MADVAARITPPVRAEFEVREVGAAQFGEVERPLSAFERVWNQTWIRRLAIVVALAAAWELHFSDETGKLWRNQIIEIRNRSEPSGIFLYERAATWGRAEFR